MLKLGLLLGQGLLGAVEAASATQPKTLPQLPSAMGNLATATATLPNVGGFVAKGGDQVGEGLRSVLSFVSVLPAWCFRVVAEVALKRSHLECFPCV